MQIPSDWTFESKEVAKHFDNHVRETLPWYDLATNAVGHLTRHYVPKNGLVYDIGASTGNIGKTIAPIIKSRNASLIAIEPSTEMAEQYDGGGELLITNAEKVIYKPFDVAICFLSLMFVEVSYRASLIQTLKKQCKVGGAIIIFDKEIPTEGFLSTILYRLTLAGKIANGISSEQVIAKELSLSGVQRPLDKKTLGKEAKLWFKFGDFSGWVIEKQESLSEL